MAYKTLFQPIRINSMTVKNRLVMPPMVRNYASKAGMATDKYTTHIDSIARGGVGMMILEAGYISREGKGFSYELGVHSDRTIPGLSKLAKTAHKHKAKIGIQLYHAGRQTTSKKSGMQPVAPSPIADPLMQEKPKQLTQKEISELIKKYADSAVRAKKAGLDFVEIHGAHGYLITQFLSPFTNKRKDRYGGSFENRLRFAKEIMQAVREAVGSNYPITMRLSADEMVPGGLTSNDTKKIAKALEIEGVNAFHISAGNYASYTKGYLIQPMAIDDGALIKYAKSIKQAVTVPIITVGKIRNPKMATQAIKNGHADLVATGRTLLADPHFPNKVQEGRLKEINPCIACNQGCIQRLFADQDVRCTTNPACSREHLFKQTQRKKRKIVIIGAGPAGLSAARTAAKAGHKVTLFEKERSIGGQLPLAGAAPHREGWNELLQTFKQDVKNLKINVRKRTEPTVAMLESINPDKIIVAVGSRANTPQIEGLENINAVTSRDVLSKSVCLKGDVVVVGGGCAGAQTAEYIAEKKHKVTIVEIGDAIALDAPLADRALLLERLEKKEVKILTNTEVVAFENKRIKIKENKKTSFISAKTAVLCLGSKPNPIKRNKWKSVCRDVVIVGDARNPRRVTEAMAEGALAAIGKPIKLS